MILSARFTRARSRSRISSAARTVNVTAQISSGFTPFSTSCAMRSVSVNVFPVPGPAITAVTRESLCTAVSCATFMVLPATGVFFSLSCLQTLSAAAATAISGIKQSSPAAISSKKEICPLAFFSSSDVKSASLPYSPSNPADLMTSPARSRRIPSAILLPPASVRSPATPRAG